MFRKILIGFFTTYGIHPAKMVRSPGSLIARLEGHGVDNGNIVDPLVFIAAAVGRSVDTIYLWTRFAENGIGIRASEPQLLDPVVAMVLIHLSEQVLSENGNTTGQNSVRDYLAPHLAAYYKSLTKEKTKNGSKRKSTGKTGSRKAGSGATRKRKPTCSGRK